MAKASYDPEVDVLYIRGSGKVSSSMEIAENFVLDLGKENKVVGIEIFHASKVLRIPKSQLKEIKKASLSTVITKTLFGARFLLLLPKTRIESQITVPVGR